MKPGPFLCDNFLSKKANFPKVVQASLDHALLLFNMIVHVVIILFSIQKVIFKTILFCA